MNSTHQVLTHGFERRAYHRYHCGQAVSAQRVLQDASELGVSVRDMRPWLGLSQRADHVTQRGERLVDGLGFIQATADRAR